ncbi:UNVERIFIED_CONTAM: hypothetical protein HHA_299670 [Hammondia hammondi]|eukprot:XP_008888421.1 hypothetical protein HHA_299670 [Hammondia hammondi]
MHSRTPIFYSSPSCCDVAQWKSLNSPGVHVQVTTGGAETRTDVENTIAGWLGRKRRRKPFANHFKRNKAEDALALGTEAEVERRVRRHQELISKSFLFEVLKVWASKAPPQSGARTRDFDKGNRVAHVQTGSNDEPDFERHYSVATSTRHTSQSQPPSGDPATHALRERVRERLKAAESARRSSNLGTDKCPKTGREGWLATVKAMIDEESNEAADDNKWDTVISKQEEGEDRIKIQALIDQEDETVFSAFLERRRQGNQQRSDLNQATRHRSAPTASSSGVAAEASHLEAIFGAGNIQAGIPKQAVDPIPLSESSKCQATATVAGANGIALLADSVLMQSGHTGAAWKRRRLLTQRTYVS